MKCLVNNTLEMAASRKKPLSVISRYIRLKYKIWLDEATLKRRLLSLKLA